MSGTVSDLVFTVARSFPIVGFRACNRNDKGAHQREAPGLLVDLGVTAGLGNDLDLAIDALGRAGEANPRLADAAYRTGMVQLVRGNREEAKQSLTRFLALAPSRSQGKIEAAKKRLEQLQ